MSASSRGDAEENLELVRRMYDAFPSVQKWLARGELPIGEPYAEAVVLDASEMRLPDMGDGVFHGREGIRRFWMAWLSAWEDVSFEYEIRGGGHKVVGLIDQSMRGTDDVDIPAGRYGQVWTFSEGQVVHWKFYSDQEDALEAAGLGE